MRFVLLAICVLAAVPVFAEVTAEKTANCAATAKIVAAAIKMRGAGADAARVKADLTSGSAAVDARYTKTVEPLVDWVFTLDDATMAADVPAAYEQQCLDFDG